MDEKRLTIFEETVYEEELPDFLANIYDLFEEKLNPAIKEMNYLYPPDEHGFNGLAYEISIKAYKPDENEE